MNDKKGANDEETGELTAKLLEGNHGLIELVILVYNDLLLLAFTNHKTGVSPTEFIHAPERVYGKEEAVYWIPAGKVRYGME